MEMDEPLEQIVNGKFDIKAAAAEFKKRQEEDAAEMAAQEELMKIMQLARKQDFTGAVKAADEVMAKHPEMAPNIATIKFRLLLTGTKEYEKAYAFAREAAEKYYSKNPMALNDIAWTILDADGVDQRDADVALTLAKRAVELTNESDGAILDTLALAYFQKGDARKAAEIQKRAVELITKAGAPEDMIEEMKERLEKFEKSANKKE
jgi:tetratricopeptide (TPR) repeat protein